MPEPKNTILLCDDDRLVLATVSSGLRSAGFEVVEADNGDDAILLARQHRPQLAVLDMRMHGKSGLDVAAYLRDYVGTPFIFLSAFGDDEIVRQARDFGALEYLVKPV
ncbi:MAG TPA: response regulator, partial [Burkholderiaceae bacterium]|nr:response regulator [Burkholderiaceae bacterium]